MRLQFLRPQLPTAESSARHQRQIKTQNRLETVGIIWTARNGCFRVNCLHSYSVSWYFEPSQPQRITSRLKTMFNLSAIYSARKSSRNQLSKNHKISPDTNLHLKKNYKNIKHKIFEEFVPSESPLFKKHIRLGHLDLSIPDINKIRKGMDRSNNNYKNII